MPRTSPRLPLLPPQRPLTQGFTLVELLVALAMMALLAIMSWRGLDGMVRTQQHTRERSEQLLVLQTALAQWGTDLDALVTLPYTTPLDWDGQVLRLTRRSNATPDEGALVVAWARRNVQGREQWLRWQSGPVRTRAQWQQVWQQAAMWARTPGDAERAHETVLLPLAGWQLFYYRGDAWSNPLSSSGSPAEGAASASVSVPDGIRLQLELPPGQGLTGLMTRDWVQPLQGGGKN